MQGIDRGTRWPGSVTKDIDIKKGTAVLGTFYCINIGYASISVVKEELIALHDEIHRTIPKKGEQLSEYDSTP